MIELRRLRAGPRVRILNGPFRNQLGLCPSMNYAQRAGVLLNFLGGEHEVRFRADAVEPVDTEDAGFDKALPAARERTEDSIAGSRKGGPAVAEARTMDGGTRRLLAVTLIRIVEQLRGRGYDGG